MDDFVILDTDKNKLSKLKILIKSFLDLNLKLRLHPKKSEYFPIDRGIDFLGYVVFAKYTLLRKSTAKRFIKKLRKKLKKLNYYDRIHLINASFLAWYSYYHHGKHYRLISKLLDVLALF